MLVENMKTVLATTYTFAIKAQQFHWNVTGPNFGELHEFFGNIYEESFGAIDTAAEIIRALGAFAPGSLQEFADETMIDDEEAAPTTGMDMIARLAEDNELMIDVLNTAYETSELEQEYDVSDFLAGRLDAHKKHGWMLHAYLGKQRQ
jgi:starvation-inducible DNA-binding protein